MKKGELLLKTLEFLAEAAADSYDLFCAVVEAGYGASARGIEYQAEKRKSARARMMREWTQKQQEEAVLRGRYAKFLYVLRRDGLVAEAETKGKTLITLTKNGLEKLARLKKGEMLPEKIYVSEDSNLFTIVAFDIPESERRKRRWLRDVLRNLGFRMLQKSVWIGKLKIPKTLLDDLQKMRIMMFVEILEITRRGTLQHII